MKCILFFTLVILSFSVIAFAGVLETIKNAATAGNIWAGLAILVVAWIFKAIPNQKIYDFVFALFQKFGTIATLGLSKYKFTAPLWNKYVEPWVIDFIDNTIGAAVKGFITGLRSDNG